jgi:branched-chain amino acid transport system permease protein
VIQGVIFVVIVMAFRKGLVGELMEWWRSRAAPKTETGD